MVTATTLAVALGLLAITLAVILFCEAIHQIVGNIALAAVMLLLLGVLAFLVYAGDTEQDDLVAEVEDRYGVTVDEHPADVTRVGRRRINDRVYRCRVDTSRPDARLRCNGEVDFADLSPSGP